MNNKVKIALLVASAIILIGIVGILIVSNQNGREIDNNSEETISISYTTLAEALNGYYDRIEKAEDEEKKKSLLDELQAYVLNDLNGYYYYYGTYAEPVNTGRSFYFKKIDVTDVRTIYVKSKDEVYIVPFSETQLSEKNVKLEEIETLDTTGMYKYKIVELKTDNKPYKKATIILQSYKVDERADKKFANIEITYYSMENRYNMSGFFVDLSTVEYDYSEEMTKNIKLESSRYYYKNEEEAIGIANEKKQESETKKQEQDALKNSIPKVGMSASEVRQTKWGYPDKVNKDTYSWGTKEQWVYNRYGYVYLENGVVTSVSQR